MPYLLVENGVLKGRVYPIKDQMLTFGRSINNNIQIDNPKASRRHAELEGGNGAYFLRDLGSSNKTYLNGEIITEDVQILDGDQIVIAGVYFRFLDHPPVDKQQQFDAEATVQTKDATVDGIEQGDYAEYMRKKQFESPEGYTIFDDDKDN